jgi:hypothetical protein
MSTPNTPPRSPRKNAAPKTIASTQSLSAFVKSICDIMRRSNCASALQYVPELTWILFLRILDAQESRDQEQADALDADFTPALRAPYRWQDWAAPWSGPPRPSAHTRRPTLRLETPRTLRRRRRTPVRLHQSIPAAAHKCLG